MTSFSLISEPNPVRQACDYFHVYPPWGYRMENVVSSSNEIQSFDLVKTSGQINKILHIKNIGSIGLAIVDTEETLCMR